MDAKTITKQGCILRAVVGSSLHGLSVAGQDDRDEMGVAIEPPEYVIGLRQFEQWVHRTKPEGVRSGPGDLDVTIYSLRKWARLALRGNPTILLLLFAPPSVCSVRTDLGDELQALASAFVARSVAAPYLGYMIAQRQRLTGERGQMRVRRAELIGQFGYDTKYAGHVIRLGLQGVELLRTGRLTLPMPLGDREKVLAIRQGRMALQDVLTWAGELEAELRDLAETSPLPPEPNAEAVDRWLIGAYRSKWAKQRLMEVHGPWIGSLGS